MNNLKRVFRKIWNFNPIFFTSALTILSIYLLTGFVHEFGHIIVCVSDGFDYTLIWEDFALNTHCSNDPDNVLLYWVLGGIFGTVASLSLFLLRKVRANKGIFVGVSVVAFDHFLKAIFETLPSTHDVYLHNLGFKLYLGVIVVVLWFGLLMFFRQRTKKET